jgi:hypothetical protein
MLSHHLSGRVLPVISSELQTAFYPNTIWGIGYSTQKQNNVCWIRVLIQCKCLVLFFYCSHTQSQHYKYCTNIPFHDIWPIPPVFHYKTKCLKKPDDEWFKKF